MLLAGHDVCLHAPLKSACSCFQRLTSTAAAAALTCRVSALAPDLGQQHWQAVMPEQAGTAIEDMDMLRDWLVLYLRRQGLPH